MTRSGLQRNLMRFAGMAAGPLAWACSTQLGQILPYVDCARRLPLLALSAFSLTAASLAGAYLSWCCRTDPPAIDGTGAETRLFSQHLSALMGVLFGFALLLQAAATIVLNPCER